MNETSAAPTPKVSVIIPAYNQANFLDNAIQSVYAQTYRDYEIVVVDDGSTDDTATVAQRHGERIRYLHQENRGLAGARNTGIRAASGELVALLDSDDTWLPDYLLTMVMLANRHPEASVFYCAARCMDEGGRPLSQIVGTSAKDITDLYWVLLRSNFLIPSTITMRRSVVEQAGMFDQGFRSCEDWDLWLRLLQSKHTFIGTPSVLAQYRVHGKSLSANTSRMQLSKRMVIEKHFGPDDTLINQWDDNKRRVYGGYYVYQVLTNVQRQNNWEGAAALSKALLVDPSLAGNISVFYELALGNQPVGWRGSPVQLDLQANALHVVKMLDEVFRTTNAELHQFRQRVYAMAWKALGLVAYNTGQFSLCRKFLLTAARYQPGILLEKQTAGNLIKSLLGTQVHNFIRDLRKGKIPEGE